MAGDLHAILQEPQVEDLGSMRDAAIAGEIIPVEIPERPVRRWKAAAVRVLGALVSIAMLPVFLFIAFYIYLLAFGLIFPGVSVAGAPVDGLTVLEAETELHRIWNEEYLISAVDPLTPENAWLIAPGDIGLEVDAAQTAAQAFAVGRGGGLMRNLQELAMALSSGWELSPIVVLNEEEAREGLAAWADTLDTAAVEGNILFEGGDAFPVHSQAGKILDIDATLALLSGDPRAILVDYRFLPFLTLMVEPTVTNVDAAAGQAHRYLRSDFRLAGFDPVTGEHFDWTPSPETLAEWMVVQREGDGLSISIGEDAVAVYIAAINANLGSERAVDIDHARGQVLSGIETGSAVSLVVHYLPTQHVVRGTDSILSIAFEVGMPYWRLQEANPMIAVHGLTVGETLIIPPRDVNLVVPALENKRIVVSITEQHMWTYEDGEVRSEHVISTGMSSSPTMPGVFQVQIHILNAYGENWDLYMPHFLGIYEAVPGFMNGIHGLPLLSNGARLWANVLGSPASYGCIILDLQAAEDVYNWAENGVVVEILP
ncbi:MAG: L,D-transpeptidase family protein [Anaerolineales bacterium]|nr:L,D-transpeptidase family protein [Anaerolineales bacterium]